jgi:hypothetical protein
MRRRAHLDESLDMGASSEDGDGSSSSGSGRGISNSDDEDSTSCSDDSSENDTGEETNNVIECSTLIDVGDDKLDSEENGKTMDSESESVLIDIEEKPMNTNLQELMALSGDNADTIVLKQ